MGPRKHRSRRGKREKTARLTWPGILRKYYGYGTAPENPWSRMPFITQVLLPKRDNAGQLFGRKQYDAFHARMLRRFGGWTRKGQAEGGWLRPSGRVFTEEHWIYEIGHSYRDLRFWQAEKDRLSDEFEQEVIWILQYEGRVI